MEKIEDISIQAEDSQGDTVEPCGSAPCSAPTGNLLPLLYEIRHALQRWLDDGTPHVIDLRGIPMMPAEESELLATLGHGEVDATLAALGNSEVFETRVSGVWLVNHHNDDGVLIGRFIEICHVPEILKSQTEDARADLQTLDNLLATAETAQ